VILWRDPLYLWICLPAVVVLGGFLLLRLRRRAALLRVFAEAPLVPRLAPDADERRSLRRMLVRVAALALLAVGLAGPKWGFHWQEVHREGIDLIVAVDTSRSMLATDVKPNRLERAKFAIMDLLPLLQGDRIGLVAFAGTAFLECPLTLDYAAFEQSLRAVEVGIIPRGGTAIARALDTSLDAFDARQGKYEAIILITDGLPTAHFEQQMLYLLYPPDPRTEAATMREGLACQREGITINMFLLPSWSQTEEDVRFAFRLAESTSGRVFFTAGRDLDRYVVWDYLSRRRELVN